MPLKFHAATFTVSPTRAGFWDPCSATLKSFDVESDGVPQSVGECLPALGQLLYREGPGRRCTSCRAFAQNTTAYSNNFSARLPAIEFSVSRPARPLDGPLPLACPNPARRRGRIDDDRGGCGPRSTSLTKPLQTVPKLHDSFPGLGLLGTSIPERRLGNMNGAYLWRY